MKSLNCYCGHTFDADIKEVIDLAADSSVVEEIINGKFQEFTCPSCGKLLRTEYRALFSENNGEKLLFIPEMERNSFLSGQINPDAGHVVIGFPELEEYFRIRESGYDRKAVELIKLYILSKTDTNPDIRIYYRENESDNMVFHIIGLKQDETGVSKIPESVYNNILKNINERISEPDLKDLFTGPYISVNKLITGVQ